MTTSLELLYTPLFSRTALDNTQEPCEPGSSSVLVAFPAALVNGEKYHRLTPNSKSYQSFALLVGWFRFQLQSALTLTLGSTPISMI